MQLMKSVRYISVTIVKIVLCLCLLFPVYAHSASGISIKQNISISGATTEPPPHQTFESFYALIIENTNDVCDEGVLISVEMPPLSQKGYSQLLGFTDSPGGPYMGNIMNFEMEDQTEKTIYFGVETGETDAGCDFRSFKAVVTVCDNGIFGMWGCDAADADGACEVKTPFIQPITQDAAPVDQPQGIGRIYGVVDANGYGIPALISLDKDILACIHGEPDNIQKYTEVFTASKAIDPGSYDAAGLPLGVYNVSAWADGLIQTKTVTLTGSNPEVSADFSFVF